MAPRAAAAPRQTRCAARRSGRCLFTALLTPCDHDAALPCARETLLLRLMRCSPGSASALHRGWRRAMRTPRSTWRSWMPPPPSPMPGAATRRARQAPRGRAWASTAARGPPLQHSRPRCSGRCSCRRTAPAHAQSGAAQQDHAQCLFASYLGAALPHEFDDSFHNVLGALWLLMLMLALLLHGWGGCKPCGNKVTSVAAQGRRAAGAAAAALSRRGLRAAAAAGAACSGLERIR